MDDQLLGDRYLAAVESRGYTVHFGHGLWTVVDDATGERATRISIAKAIAVIGRQDAVEIYNELLHECHDD